MFYKFVNNLWLLSLFVFFCYPSLKANVIDKTEEVFSASTGYKGVIAAYADVNNDKATDVFIISGAKNVTLLYGNKHDSIKLLPGETISFSKDVHMVASGDFNGDGFVDVLASSLSDSNVFVHIAWGTSKGFSNTSILNINVPLKKQPMLLDVNGDMITDLLVNYANGTRQFWTGQSKHRSKWSFNMCDFPVSSTNVATGTVAENHSDAFLDFFGNGFSDLFIVSRIDNSYSFDIWKGTEKGMDSMERRLFTFNESKGEIGQSAFIDIDMDGYLDHILPVCYHGNEGCQHSKILVYKNNKWIPIFESNNTWNFRSSSTNEGLYLSISLVTGDYNQDANVDILCIMENKELNLGAQAVVLYGRDCNKPFCSDVGKMFEFGFSISTPANVFFASFYDLANDGTLDILLSIEGSQLAVRRLASATYSYTRAYKNYVASDVSFLVVKVLPGLRQNSGSNVYGACVSYVTTNTAGGNMHMSSCQLTQSSHFALQLPYIHFGLGRLPNFLDKITVTVPSTLLKCNSKHDFKPRQNQWTMIIPNSLLYIKPYPLNNPSSWRNRMLISPSNNVVTVGIVLLSTCMVVSLAIISLHCMEKRIDLQEKINDVHRFHFDAM